MAAYLKNGNSGQRVSRAVNGSFVEVFISDIHYPFTDWAANDLTRKLLRYIKPDLVYLGGDIVDNHATSRHKKAPLDRLRFAEEIRYAGQCLADLRRAAKNAVFDYHEGNHDANLQFFLDTQAEALAGLEEIKLPRLLKLEDLGIRWLPEGTRSQVGKLHHIHGHEISGTTARAKFLQVLVNMICGHHHFFDSHGIKDYEGQTRKFWINATLFAEPSYVHHDKSQLGLTVITYVKGGYFDVEQVQFHTQGGVRFAVYKGRVFESEIKRPESDGWMP